MPATPQRIPQWVRQPCCAGKILHIRMHETPPQRRAGQISAGDRPGYGANGRHQREIGGGITSKSLDRAAEPHQPVPQHREDAMRPGRGSWQIMFGTAEVLLLR